MKWEKTIYIHNYFLDKNMFDHQFKCQIRQNSCWEAKYSQVCTWRCFSVVLGPQAHTLIRRPGRRLCCDCCRSCCCCGCCRSCCCCCCCCRSCCCCCSCTTRRLRWKIQVTEAEDVSADDMDDSMRGEGNGCRRCRWALSQPPVAATVLIRLTAGVSCSQEPDTWQLLFPL